MTAVGTALAVDVAPTIAANGPLAEIIRPVATSTASRKAAPIMTSSSRAAGSFHDAH